jgi:pimeloyl-ACP methyl ester carboxylesterase
MPRCGTGRSPISPSITDAWRPRCRSGRIVTRRTPTRTCRFPASPRLVAEFLDRLDLRDVTLVGNDTGGALVQLLMCDGAARVGTGCARLLRCVRQLPARTDRQDARARRHTPAADVRAVHAADAAPGAAAAPDRVRVADVAGRRCHRPVDEASHATARDPPRRRANPAFSRRGSPRPSASSPTHPPRPETSGEGAR